MYAHTCPTGGKLILRAITVVLAQMSLWGEREGRIFAQGLCERVVSEERAVWYSGEMGNSYPDGLDTLNRIVRGQDLAQGEPIATDRPDFTEASSTVPRGRVQFETGYTFTYDVEDGVIHRAHTAPELLVRYGFSDDIEIRLAWTYLWQNTKSRGVSEPIDGAEDMVVGVKLALSQQQRWWPESAVILQLGVPTGARAFSHRHLESGVNWLYGWDISERWSIAGSSGAQTGSELVLVSLPLGEFSFRDQQIVFHQSVTTGWAFTERVGGFFEYFVLHTDGDQQDRSDHFLDGGFTSLVNDDTQWDIRAGLGLNKSADDFFVGIGYSQRR